MNIIYISSLEREFMITNLDFSSVIENGKLQSAIFIRNISLIKLKSALFVNYRSVHVLDNCFIMCEYSE